MRHFISRYYCVDMRPIFTFLALVFFAAIVQAGSYLTSKDAQFKLSWRIIKNASVAQFRISYTPKPRENRWFALAFHANSDKNTMANTDYALLEYYFSGSELKEVKLSDRYTSVKGAGTPTLDTDLGGTDDLFDFEFVWKRDENAVECSFKRPLVTGDGFDQELGDFDIRFAWAHGQITPTGQFLKHVGTVEGLNLNILQTSIDPPSVPTHWETVKTILQSAVFWHALCMFVSWWILMLPAGMLARYAKFVLPRWFFIHWKLQALSVVVTVTGFICVWAAKEWQFPNPFFWMRSDLDETSTWIKTHGVLGMLLLFILLPLQLFLGYMSNKMWYRGKPPHFYPDKSHWLTGWILMLVGGLVQCGTGVEWYIQYLGDLVDVEKQLSSGRDVRAVFWTLAVWAVLALVAFEILIGQKHEHDLVNGTDHDSDASSLNSDEELLLEPGVEERQKRQIDGKRMGYLVLVVGAGWVVLSVVVGLALAGIVQ